MILQINRNNIVDYYGLKEKNDIFGVTVIRPILNYTKLEIIEYLTKNNISFYDDPTNYEQERQRNILRANLKNIDYNHYKNLKISLNQKVKEEKDKIKNIANGKYISKKIYSTLNDNEKKRLLNFLLNYNLGYSNSNLINICLMRLKSNKSFEENLKNKKQTILFLNRRGFATFIMCRDCGYTAKCKNCDITLTYHLKENKLKCHYCGYETNALTVCPECGGKNIRYFGTGTQKLEEQIKTMFPDATTIRMDIDTVTKKNSHEDILNSFKKDGIDILIGTQMVVKGHDFPNVTLVGVIAADSSLNIDDYRAHERTFQTLTQVAGRAGRGKDKGRVIIQTYNPDAFCIQYSQKQDYKLFYDTEIHLRKQLRYPPFCDIILIGVSSKSYKELEETSNKIYESLKAKIHTEKLQILLYKPVPAPIDRIKNKFRWRIIVKCIVGEPIINAIDDTVKNAGNKNTKNDTRIVVDVNPSNML